MQLMWRRPATSFANRWNRGADATGTAGLAALACDELFIHAWDIGRHSLTGLALSPIGLDGSRPWKIGTASIPRPNQHRVLDRLTRDVPHALGLGVTVFTVIFLLELPDKT
ncbi:MAG TPA: hypothetical protein VFR68_05250, partial [Candidatus Dormibacteraeota bacterium]|nr:hypothetical protein [Candidatus Dormibacteraeota bacterium]